MCFLKDVSLRLRNGEIHIYKSLVLRKIFFRISILRISKSNHKSMYHFLRLQKPLEIFLHWLCYSLAPLIQVWKRHCPLDDQILDNEFYYEDESEIFNYITIRIIGAKKGLRRGLRKFENDSFFLIHFRDQSQFIFIFLSKQPNRLSIRGSLSLRHLFITWKCLTCWVSPYRTCFSICSSFTQT